MHPVLGQRPGLVGADHVSRPERLDGTQPLDHCAPSCELADTDRQRQSDDGQQALGDVADDEPDREDDRLGDGEASRDHRERNEHGGHRYRDRRDEPGNLPHVLLERALLALDPLGQCRDAAQLGLHSRGEHQRSRASPPVQLVPEKTRSRACISGMFVSVAAADRSTGIDSPVSADVSTSIAPDTSRASAEIRCPSSISRTSPGTRPGASMVCSLPSRRTCAWDGRYSCSASTARSA